MFLLFLIALNFSNHFNYSKSGFQHMKLFKHLLFRKITFVFISNVDVHGA